MNPWMDGLNDMGQPLVKPPPMTLKQAQAALLADQLDWSEFEASVDYALRHSAPKPKTSTYKPSSTYRPAPSMRAAAEAPAISPEAWAMARLLLVLAVVVGIAIAAGPVIVVVLAIGALIWIGKQA